MIRALEQHLAHWLQTAMAELAAETPLFQPITVSLGPNPPAAAPEGVLVQVQALNLTPVVENQAVELPEPTADDQVHLLVALSLRLSGPRAPLASEGLIVEPASAQLHAVDLVALTLLARLRRRARLGPDDAPMNGDNEGPDGRVEARGGTRRTLLQWHDLMPGPAELTESGGSRIWEVPLSGRLSYRLSPALLEGGRILQIPVKKEILPAREEG